MILIGWDVIVSETISVVAKDMTKRTPLSFSVDFLIGDHQPEPSEDSAKQG